MSFHTRTKHIRLDRLISLIDSDLLIDCLPSSSLTTSQEAMRVCPTEDNVHCSNSDSGSSGSMDQVSWDSVEAQDWSSDEAADVPAAATASSGSIRKLLRRIRKFFSSLTSCCCPKVELYISLLMFFLFQYTLYMCDSPGHMCCPVFVFCCRWFAASF